MSWWKSIAREPLVHFVAIGALLFAIDHWRSPDEPAEERPAPAAPAPAAPPPSPAPAAPPARSIVIDAEVRTLVAANAERRLGRAPTAAELADELQRWIDEEVLYREAVARGLDRDDPVIHQRIAGRMSYVLEQAAIVPEPTEAELRAWFEQHRERWTVAEHVDFTHVFIAGNDAAAAARAGELEAALGSGAAPERLGDRFSGGHRYRGRKVADLAAAFGESFVDGLAKQRPGSWVRRTSRHGIHLVRVDRLDAAQPADFARARLDVRKEWVDARRAAEVGAAMEQLRSAWTIEQR
jgi:peptidyl-prolyl cis-trans isomerase C